MAGEGQVHSPEMARFLRELGYQARDYMQLAAAFAAFDVAAGFTLVAVSLLFYSPARVWGLPLVMGLGALAGYGLGVVVSRYAVPLQRRHARWALIEGGLLAGVIDDHAHERLPGLERDPLDSPLLRSWRPPRRTKSFRQRLTQLLRSWTQCCSNLKISPVPQPWSRNVRTPLAVVTTAGGLLALVWLVGRVYIPGLTDMLQVVATLRLVYWYIALLVAPAIALVTADGYAAQSGRRLALLDVLESRSNKPPSSRPAAGTPELYN